jgi:hypothetical protein
MIEHQNAYELSRMEHRSTDEETRAALDAGLFVAVMTGPVYCRFTDAFVGTRAFFISAHDTREAAQKAANAEYDKACDDDGPYECDFEVLPRLPRPVPVPFDFGDDDIPF